MQGMSDDDMAELLRKIVAAYDTYMNRPQSTEWESQQDWASLKNAIERGRAAVLGA